MDNTIVTFKRPVHVSKFEMLQNERKTISTDFNLLYKYIDVMYKMHSSSSIDVSKHVCMSLSTLVYNRFHWFPVNCSSLYINASFICEKNKRVRSTKAMQLFREVRECKMHEIMIEFRCFHSIHTKQPTHLYFNNSVIEMLSKYMTAWTLIHINEMTIFNNVKVICVFQKARCECFKTVNTFFSDKKIWSSSDKSSALCDSGNITSVDKYIVVTSPIVQITNYCVSTGQYRCDDETCIVAHHQCDGKYDCPDGSDETDCHIECSQLFSYFTPCLDCIDKIIFKCKSGACISLSKVCNGISDCHDSTDELECRNYQYDLLESKYRLHKSYPCPKGWSLCNTATHFCYPNDKICIFDRSNDGPLHCPYTEHIQYCADHVCPNAFKCSGSYCIPMRMVCDGVGDCPNKEDESSCPVRLVCKGMLLCRNDNICVHPSEICDGVSDCISSNDDEELCHTSNCQKGCICNGNIVICSEISYFISQNFNENTKGLFLINMKVKFLQRFLRFTELTWVSFKDSILVDLLEFRNAFRSHNSIKLLDFRYSNLNSTKKNMFERFSQLKYLFFQGCYLHTVDSFTFNQISTLYSIDFSFLKINIIHDRTFCVSANINHVNISNNNLKMIHKETFSCLVHLYILDLSNNLINGIEYGSFDKLIKLIYVYTDSHSQCCHIKKNTKCQPRLIQIGIQCNDILVSFHISCIYFIFGASIIVLNVSAILINIKVVKKRKDLIFTQNMFLINMLCGLYLLLLCLRDYLYRYNYIQINNTSNINRTCLSMGLLPLVYFIMTNAMVCCLSIQKLIVIKYYFQKRFIDFQSKSTQMALTLICWIISICISSWLNIHFAHESLLCFTLFTRNSTFNSYVFFITIYSLTNLIITTVTYQQIISYTLSVEKFSKGASTRATMSSVSVLKRTTIVLGSQFFSGFLNIVSVSLYTSLSSQQEYMLRILLLSSFPLYSITTPVTNTFLILQTTKKKKAASHAN